MVVVLIVDFFNHTVEEKKTPFDIGKHLFLLDFLIQILSVIYYDLKKNIHAQFTLVEKILKYK